MKHYQTNHASLLTLTGFSWIGKEIWIAATVVQLWLCYNIAFSVICRMNHRFEL